MQFFGSGTNEQLNGVIGVEIFGTVALLRSLAVTPACRSRGLGRALVTHAERHACQQGVETLYLLTDSAEPFFAERGYAQVARTEAPPAIQTTAEFARICPGTAAFMMKRLRRDCGTA